MLVVTQRSKFHISCNIRLDGIYGELLSQLTFRLFAHNIREVRPSMGWRCCVVCGGGAWSLVGEGVGACMLMVGPMCRVGLRNGGSSEELRDVSEIVRWFGRVEGTAGGAENTVSGCGLIEVDRVVRGGGWPCAGHGCGLS